MNEHQIESVDINIESKDIFMNFETATHLGLILNEIIINSFKYAFPDGRGTISIIFQQFDDHFSLIVEDDGIGFTVNDVLETDTLGLKLVNELVEQIQGTIHIDGSSGTRYTINFRNSDPSKKDLSFENKL